MSDIDDLTKDLGKNSKEEQLRDRIDELLLQNATLKKTLEEYGIDEYSIVNDVEYICIKGIEDLKKLSDAGGLTLDDTKVLDTLHKNLRLARGKIDKKEPKGKKASVEDLLKIVETK